MKITKAERAALWITVAVIAFLTGFYLHGRVFQSGITVSTERTLPAAVSQTSAPEASAALPSPSATAVSDGRIDLNTATQAELEALPDIGPVRARSILDYREAHGGFSSVSELLNVEGIGEKTLEKIADYVKVG